MICKSEFIVPLGGFADLPNNFFIEKLLDIDQMPTKRRHDQTCDVCVSSSATNDYCLNCCQHLCDECSATHQNISACKFHKIVTPSSDLEKAELLMIKIPFCNRHENEALKLYCYQCKCTVCALCFVDEHQMHKCATVDKVAEELRQRLTTDSFDMAKYRANITEGLAKLNLEKKKLRDQTEMIEEHVIQRSEELHAKIHDMVRSLTSEVMAIHATQMKEIETVEEELNEEVTILESFEKYSEEVSNRGTDCDVCSIAQGLLARAAELRKIRKQGKNMSSVDLSFAPFIIPAWSMFKLDDLVGKIQCNKTDISLVEASNMSYLMTPALIHTLPQEPRLRPNVCGVAIIRDELFVVTEDSNKVIVFETVNFDLRRFVPVSGLESPMDMVACTLNDCLYISNNARQVIHKTSISDHHKLSNVDEKWRLKPHEKSHSKDVPYGLSITQMPSIIVALMPASKLMEITLDGDFIREIHVPQDHLYPIHGVRSMCDGFVVCFQRCRPTLLSDCDHNQNPKGHVSLVSSEGQIMKTFRGSSAHGLIDNPSHMTVDKYGYVFLADSTNHRIILLSPTMDFVTEFVVPGMAGSGVNCPLSLCLDEKRGLLYVGEFDQGRIFVFRVKEV